MSPTAWGNGAGEQQRQASADSYDPHDSAHGIGHAREHPVMEKVNKLLRDERRFTPGWGRNPAISE